MEVAKSGWINSLCQLNSSDPGACVIAADVPVVSASLHRVAEPSRETPGPRRITRVPPGAGAEVFAAGVSGCLNLRTGRTGLQLAALKRAGHPDSVCIDEVSICRRFLRTCANWADAVPQFVGLNARQLPWTLNNRPGVDFISNQRKFIAGKSTTASALPKIGIKVAACWCTTRLRFGLDRSEWQHWTSE